MVARREYRRRLVAVEDLLLRAAEGYRGQLSWAVAIVVAGDEQAVPAVIAEDERLGRIAADVRNDTMQLLALQSPVADELRLLTAILDVDVAVGHIGALAIEVARTARAGDPDLSEPLLQQFAELGTLVDRLTGRALEHFARRRDAGTGLGGLSGRITALRDDLQDRAVTVSRSHPDRVAWAMRVTLAAAFLHRAADLADGIGRQARSVARGTPAPTRI